jgi:thiol-disulfide isomerase/thioredoxin
MKTRFTLLLISLSLVSQAQERNFVLMGRIIGADSSKKAILTQWDIGRTDTSLIHNGQFIFKGQVRYPTLATVGTDKVHQGLGVWLSNDTIRSSFKIDGRFLQPVAVVGPPESEDYLTNINQINTYNSSGLSTPQKNQQIADLISQYVLNHTNSYYSLFLLTTNTRFLSLSQSKELTASLSPALQNSEPGKSLESQLRNEAVTAMNKVIDSFSLPDTNGVLRTVIPTRKPYTLLSFWASWCAPCRAHNQDLVKLYQRIDHSQIELISISLDDNRKAWLKAIAKDGLKWDQLSDLKYLSGPVAKQLALSAVPQFLLVDRSNKIVAISLHDAIQVIDKK